ncbi:HTTM domain-containing protein [Arthrobacter sp. MPF02]|uniref:HTTM domain-containing protein n=1 Tax=Arthrobacter sp. MPF02 TaxID=3388492 RepID=UPI00398555D6
MLQILTAKVDPRPLAAARIITGLVAVGFTFEWGRTLLRASSGNFLTMPVVTGWPPVDPTFTYALVALSLTASLAMAVGFSGRIPAIIVACTTGTVLLSDQQTYSNHLVLLFLMTTWISLSGAHRVWRLPFTRRRDLVPYWPAFLIKVLISSLYAWTAVSKINPQYLSGEVIGTYLQPWVPISDHLLPVTAALSILAEAFLSVALWLARLRKLAFLVGAGLHLGIVICLESSAPLVGFGASMLSGYIIFGYGKAQRVPTDGSAFSGHALQN